MNYRLGKKEVRFDHRTIQLSEIFRKELPPIPTSFNVAESIPGINLPYGDDYGNIDHGDCVEVIKYILQILFEMIEQGMVLPVVEKDVLDQYFSETGGKTHDDGLVMLDSLVQWKNTGIKVGGRKVACVLIGGTRYKNHAFAQINPTKIEEIKASIFLLHGVATGLVLPLTAQDQMDKGQIWDVVDKPGNEPGSWGGHGVASYAYKPVNEKTDKYLIGCYTWGKFQWMTSDFWAMYSDEDYAVVDAKDTPDSSVDEEKLEGFLTEIKKTVRIK